VAPEDNEQAPPQHAPGNALTEVFAGCSTARLFTASLRTAAELGFPIAGRDDAHGTFAFRIGRPNTAWPMQEFFVAVHQDGAAARIVLKAKPTGYRPLLADWHQAKAAGILYLDRLSSVLESERESAPDVPAPPSVAEQLKSLADLRERGVLSDEEFAVAKERLLN
jgi:hypothetical protein